MAGPKLGIVGSGIAALWLAREARLAGFSCTVIGEQPLAQFASTRNQGWLQSGAYYAARNDPEAARDCAIGYRDILAYAPEAIFTETPSYFFFEQQVAMENCLHGCIEHGIRAQEEDIAKVARTIPAAAGTRLPLVLKVEDRPMDARRIIRKVASEAFNAGAHFVDAVPSDIEVSSWKIVRDQSGTRIAGPFDVLILACGPCIKKIATSLDANLGREYDISTIEVVSMHGEFADAMLLTPSTTLGPNVVPFRFAAAAGDPAISGVSVCLNGGDISGSVLSAAPRASVPRMVIDKLNAFYPGIGQNAKTSTPRNARVHACQKLQRARRGNGRGMIVDDLAAHGLPGMFVLYPGKFTTARLAARACLGRIIEFLGEPSVMPQPYAEYPLPDTVSVVYPGILSWP